MKVKVQTTTRSATELDGIGKAMHKQAQTVEERWRMAHGIDEKLRGKNTVEPKRNRQPLERNQVKRREQRQQLLIDRSLLRKPSLIATTGEAGDDGPRLIKRAEMQQAPPAPTTSTEPPRSGYGVEPKGKRGWKVRKMRRNGTLPP